MAVGTRFSASPDSPQMTLDDFPRRRLMAAVFLISVASLALEVLQMRMFAYAVWQHLAFLVISIAMLGFGAAGSVLAASRKLREANLGNAVAVASLLFATSAIVGPYYLAANPVDIFQQVGAKEIGLTALYYLLFSLPFFFAGYTVALALTRGSKSAGLLYGANMLGSGIGCFVIFFTLQGLGAGGTLFILAGLGAVVATISAQSSALRGVGAVLALALMGASPLIESSVEDNPPNGLDWFGDQKGVAGAKAKPWYELRLQPTDTKMMMDMWSVAPQGRLLVSEWTPLCKIDVLALDGADGVLVQDGDAGAPLWRSEEPMLPRDLTQIPHVLLDAPDVLIIGSGCGREIQTCLEAGANSVQGAEINPVTVEVCLNPEMTLVSKYGGERGLVPENAPAGTVRVENAEGRYFVRSSDRKYDLITMTGVDTYTALVSGSNVVSESYLYTKEAVLDFYDHLEDDGLISYIRWAFPTPRETLKMMVIICEALRERGIAEPWKHIAITRNAFDDSPFTKGTILASTLIKKSPFTEEERDKLRAFAAEHSLMSEYIPGDPPKFSEEQLTQLRSQIEKNPLFEAYPLTDEGINPFHAYAEALRAGTEEEFLDGYPYNIRHVTDDRPFFFEQHYMSSLWNWIIGRAPEYETKSDSDDEGGPGWMGASAHFDLRPTGMILLFITLIQLLVMAAICIFGPLAFLRRQPGAKRGGYGAPILYFACLGFAYIFLMMSSVQRFGLVLGHPSYAISVTMATFMISSGIGAMLSGGLSERRGKGVLLTVAAFLVLATVALQMYLPQIANYALGQDFSMRVMVTVAVLSPMAFAMGMCFPIGLRVLRERNESLVPWAYAVNGSASVLGSVIAIFLAMALGFAAVQWVSAVFYVLAAIAMGRMLAGSSSQTA